jgi:hypothetical protein
MLNKILITAESNSRDHIKQTKLPITDATV